LRVLSSFLLVLLFVVGSAVVAPAKVTVEEVAKLLPREIGVFRLKGPLRQHQSLVKNGDSDPRFLGDPAGFPGFAGAEAEYVSPKGELLQLELVHVERDSDAYSLLTILARNRRDGGADVHLSRSLGTAGFASTGSVAFFQGRSFVRITNPEGGADESLNTLAKLLADRLEKGEGDVPVLVKHVPQWETAQADAVYLAGFRSLKGAIPNQPVLEAITSEGDADAVLTSYGSAQFLLVEFNTPQLASDNDRAITAKLNELRQQGQPVPTSYRKVGNYSVFVFNAGSEAEAQSLIDQIEYAQMVTWLGDNPYLLEQAQRDYYETTAGVLVSVVQASGLSLLGCLGIGGLIGAVLFNRRRAQQRAAEAYSDAGGMLRLNLDDITPQSDPAKLLRP
jgi:hypothetical protein